MLAEAHDLPRETVAYLHALVGRAHNTVYRARGFRVRGWAAELLDEVPRRLRADPALKIASVVFWGLMALAGLLAAARPEFTEALVGEEQIAAIEAMYAEPVDAMDREDELMTGFYINHNAAIGLKCYAYGLSFGIMTLYELSFQALVLGALFGHMATTPAAANFYEFVTAHGPFELTAIVMAGAAGLRLGWGLIDTKRDETDRLAPTRGAGLLADRRGRDLPVRAGRLPGGVRLRLDIALCRQSRDRPRQRLDADRLRLPRGTPSRPFERTADGFRGRPPP